MRSLRLAASALVVCAALGGCAGQGASDGTSTTTGAAPVTSQPSPEPTTPSDPVAPMPTVPPKGTSGPTKPPPAGDTTLTGTVQAGVEPNCLLLDGHLLIGGPRDLLKPGTRVTVTGRPQPDMMTTCQQGTPFVVESARRA